MARKIFFERQEFETEARFYVGNRFSCRQDEGKVLKPRFCYFAILLLPFHLHPPCCFCWRITAGFLQHGFIF